MIIFPSKVWCEPLERALSRVMPADIPKALKFFGEEVNILYMHPKIKQAVSSVIPGGIEFIENEGCDLWEIWGAVDPDLKKEVTEAPTEPPETPPQPQEIVLKQPTHEILPPPVIAVVLKPTKKAKRAKRVKHPKVCPIKELVLTYHFKHGGGRPRKKGEVSRSTEWRRRKKLQGKLI